MSAVILQKKERKLERVGEGGRKLIWRIRDPGEVGGRVCMAVDPSWGLLCLQGTLGNPLRPFLVSQLRGTTSIQGQGRECSSTSYSAWDSPPR